jgi:hypothetical protein
MARLALDKAALRSWRVEEAAALVRRLVPVAHRHGYTLGLYGSTLGGQGRDLDMVAFPWGDRRPGRRIVAAVAAAVGGRVVERRSTPFARAAGILLPDGRLLDVQIPRTTIAPRARRAA